VIVGCGLTGIVFLQNYDINTRKQNQNSSEFTRQEQAELQRLTLISRSPRLGFDNMLSNWVYLGFIQYFGDTEARQKTGYSLTPKYFSLVVDQDPHFVEALTLIEVANSLFAALPETSVSLLSRALEKIQPNFISRIEPYYLWRTKGNDQLLFLGDVIGAKKSYAKSIEWAENYDNDDSRKIADISRRSIDFLNNNSDSKSARIGAWVNILANNPDPKVRARVVEEIEKLGGKIKVLSPSQISVSVPQGSN
jgi:hypothetical protein